MYIYTYIFICICIHIHIYHASAGLDRKQGSLLDFARVVVHPDAKKKFSKVLALAFSLVS